MGRAPETVLSPFFAGGEWRRGGVTPPYGPGFTPYVGRDAPIPPRAGIHFTANP